MFLAGPLHGLKLLETPENAGHPAPGVFCPPGRGCPVPWRAGTDDAALNLADSKVFPEML
jgi:hypothetical protein